MRIHLGSDHAGLEMKQHLAKHLAAGGHQVIDHGPWEYDAEDDYPTFCVRTGEAVVADPGSLAVVIGGSGNGEQIAANKAKGVRAALAWSVQTATLARLHNDANVIAIGARMTSLDDAVIFVDAFVGTEFSHDPRHARRIAELAEYEASGALPPLPTQP